TAHGSGLGKTRWVVERTFAWLHQFKRLRIRYDCGPHSEMISKTVLRFCVRTYRHR
ncbi:transposase, partial [Streptomyces nigra]